MNDENTAPQAVERGLLAFQGFEAYFDEKIKIFKKECGLYGECGLCGHEGNLFQDHDHANRLNRAKLCHHCNVGLGNFRDDPERLYKAVDYLKRWQVFHAGLTPKEKQSWRYKYSQKKKRKI